MNAKMDDFKNNLGTLVALFVAGGFAGLAAFLRLKEPVTKVAMFSAFLNSAFFTVGFFALSVHFNGLENGWLNFGLSLMAGLGGNTAIGIGTRTWESVAEAIIKGKGK